MMCRARLLGPAPTEYSCQRQLTDHTREWEQGVWPQVACPVRRQSTNKSDLVSELIRNTPEGGRSTRDPGDRVALQRVCPRVPIVRQGAGIRLGRTVVACMLPQKRSQQPVISCQ